jgi:hypothetical protein
MELAIDIVKSLLLSKLKKDTNFDNNNADATFWKSFATSLLDFETNDTLCKNAIYSLKLDKPESMIAKLPNIYNLYIRELAENYVLGNKSEAIESLLKSKNKVFVEEVRFLNNLEEAITEIEHERIKAILSAANETLIEEQNKKDKKETEVVSLSRFRQVAASTRSSRSWIKYAAAACIFFTIGIIYFNTGSSLVQPGDTNVVTAPVKEETKTPEIPSETLAEVATVTNNATVNESGMGVSSNTIKITENNQKSRMISIVTAIENYQKLLEKEFSQNKVGVGTRAKVLESKIYELQNELALLKAREKQYIFDGKSLVLYVSTAAKENFILLYGDSYYLKRDADFYILSVANAPQLYRKISDTNLINNLEDILSENGK